MFRTPGSTLSRRALLASTAATALGVSGPLLPDLNWGRSARSIMTRPAKPPFVQPTAYRLEDGRWVPSDRRPTDAELRSQFLSLVRCGARQLYVSGSGSDAQAGTREQPFRQISTAIARAVPGDLIVVGDGSYGHTDIRGFHGSADRWLGIMTESASTRAVINVPPPTDNFLSIVDSHHVGLYGFEVRGDQHNPNTNGSGISVHANSYSIAIWANHVHDFPGGGINCFDVDGSHDLIDISFNTIHATSRFSPMNTSGISVYASRDLTQGARFADGFGYRIVGNYVYDVVCLVPFRAGGFDFVTDGNGISLDKISTSYGYAKPILVAGNVVTSCGGRGVLAFETRQVLMTHNVAVGNLRTSSPGISRGTELEGKTDTSVQILDNVIYPMNTLNSTDHLSHYSGNVVLGGWQLVPRGNLDKRALHSRYFVENLTGPVLSTGPSLDHFVAR